MEEQKLPQKFLDSKEDPNLFSFTFGKFVKNLTDDQTDEKEDFAAKKSDACQPQQDRDDDDAESETGIF